MPWFVIHTKPRQEARALENLERQGFNCFLPTITRKKNTRSGYKTVHEALFSRYLFIELDTTLSGRSWAPIRSTLGVSRLVTFGIEPARIAPALIAYLRDQQARYDLPESAYKKGDQVQIITGPFAGVEAIYEMDDGEQRAMVLIEIMHRLTKLKVDITDIRSTV